MSDGVAETVPSVLRVPPLLLATLNKEKTCTNCRQCVALGLSLTHPCSQFDGRKIYFGNLSWGMDHLDLQDLCSEFGQVEDARLITDRETGRSKGFGFVTMSSVSEAEEVVNQLNGQDVDGRVLRVNIAQPRGGN